ncbi:MAG: hypothetical protein JSV85_02865 [Candidatus Bathyarchaeota archaeon]|nr:MAG: hypothetical protein JSV85_02865 [Candidatus Bathyarchaeota archaeon]
MSRRPRRRYLHLAIESEQLVTEEDVTNSIWSALLRLFGEYGTSHVNLTLIEYSRQRNYAIVRCSHKALGMVRASITSIIEINGKPSAIHVVAVSGTLKALRRKAAM